MYDNVDVYVNTVKNYQYLGDIKSESELKMWFELHNNLHKIMAVGENKKFYQTFGYISISKDDLWNTVFAVWKTQQRTIVKKVLKSTTKIKR